MLGSASRLSSRLLPRTLRSVAGPRSAARLSSSAILGGQTKGLTSSLEDVDSYLAVVGPRAPAIVEELRQATVDTTGHKARLQLDRASIQFLTWQLRQMKATRILEIGTFTGSTALAFACTAAANANLRPGRPLSPAAAAGSADPAPAASPGGLSEEVVGTGVVNGKSEFTGPMKHPILTDPSLLPTRGPCIATLEVDTAPFKSIGLPYWAKAGAPSPALPLWCLSGSAIETMQLLAATDCVGSFDAVFIDADKAAYPVYYELALTLLRKGGVVALDNVLRRGHVIREWKHSAAGHDVAGAAAQTDAAAATAAAAAAAAPAESGSEAELKTSAKILHQLNVFIAKDARVQHCLLPVGDGLLIATKL